MKNTFLPIAFIFVLSCQPSSSTVVPELKDTLVENQVSEMEQAIRNIGEEMILESDTNTLEQEGKVDSKFHSNTDNSTLTFNEKVIGCASNKNNVKKSDFFGREIEELSPQIKISGHSFLYERSASQLCDLKVHFEKQIEGNVITIKEVWTGRPAKCDCKSYLSFEVGHLPKGEYRVKVLQIELLELGINDEENTELLLEKSIQI